MKKKKTESSNCIGLCTVQIRWQNADGNTNVYPVKIGFIAEGYNSKGMNVVKDTFIDRAKVIVSSHPDFFDSKDKKYVYSANVKTLECETFHIFSKIDFMGSRHENQQ